MSLSHLTPQPRIHGGPSALGAAPYDFSTNANAVGPCPHTLAALQQVDARNYPDPSYSALRQALAQFHHVAPERIVLAASGSEAIQRLTAAALRVLGQHTRTPALHVWWPERAYGDYAHAATAWGLGRCSAAESAQLLWLCDPSSPEGLSLDPHCLPSLFSNHTSDTTTKLPPMVVLDCAYAPLRLHGSAPAHTWRDRCWQVWTPNKALGLTGIRAAYIIAPINPDTHTRALIAQCDALQASWPLGAHGVALLQTWVTPTCQTWLQHSLDTLRQWHTAQTAALQALGWQVSPSDAPFFLIRHAQYTHADARATLQQHLWQHGIALRDAASLGAPGAWRVRVHTPEARARLVHSLALSQQG